jgi:hypothetical protein
VSLAQIGEVVEEQALFDLDVAMGKGSTSRKKERGRKEGRREERKGRKEGRERKSENGAEGQL